MKKKFVAIAVVTIAIFTLFGCIEKEPNIRTSTQANDNSEVIAKVNEETITINSLNKRAQQWSVMYGEYFAQPEGRLEILEEMVNDALLMQEVKKRGLEKDPMVVESLRAYREQLDEQFIYYKSHTLKNKLVESAVPPPQEIDEKEAERFYQENPEDFGEKAKVWARHILVKNKEDADSVLVALDDGADFAKLAAEKSLDEPTTKKGGELGSLEKGMMYPEMDAVIFDMVPNEIRAVELKNGFYKGYFSVIQITKIDAAKIYPFEGVKDQVKEKMTQLEIRSHYQAYVDKLKKSANIVTYPEKVAAVLPGFDHPPMSGESVSADSVPNDATHRNIGKTATTKERSSNHP